MCHWQFELVADDENADAAGVRVGFQCALDFARRELRQLGAKDDDIGSRLGRFAQDGRAI